jgi:hypothetical protein
MSDIETDRPVIQPAARAPIARTSGGPILGMPRRTVLLVTGGIAAVAIMAVAAVMVSRNQATEAQAVASIPAASASVVQEATAAAQVENATVNAQAQASQAAANAATAVSNANAVLANPQGSAQPAVPAGTSSTSVTTTTSTAPSGGAP